MTAKVRVGGLRGYSELVKELGGDPRSYTRACGIADGLLQHEDALLPYRQLVQLLERTADSLGIADFGLRLAARQDIGVLGPLALAMQNSASVEDAIRCAASYLFIQSPALSQRIDKLVRSTRLELAIDLAHLPHDAMCQAEDLALGVSHGVVQLLAQEDYRLIRVELPHGPLLPASRYEAYFGAPVQFSSGRNALYVSPATLDKPLLQRSEQLHRLATDYLDVQTPTADERYTTRVETAVRKSLATGSCSRTAIARAMAMHPRTLQRRLHEEGTSFDAIRDDVRRATVDHYLRHTDMPLSQVAGLVGYSEQAILTRSCQRWFGQTPRRMRLARSD
ncbi:helix-turn-helix domain-containing protein [Seongchinamella sediminis]|uniref:Helix-turn-helix domain-containing protein n=1 Tax=Seongchinamella sediminis TaxID=2283635 RepID=A0A3L7E229_9GAMM|nr:AraC family transcriptional regulator [Seongchinamella sediminis]RLQ22383.1 helix-turn-helix domain-containing protein [Seongchinamella sediminis]